jgi:hypothetical protein
MIGSAIRANSKKNMISNPKIFLYGVSICMAIYWIAIASKMAKEKRRRRVALALALLGAVMLAWPTVGYALIIDKQDHRFAKTTVTFLTALRVNLIGIATGMGVALALTGHLFGVDQAQDIHRKKDEK